MFKFNLPFFVCVIVIVSSYFALAKIEGLSLLRGCVCIICTCVSCVRYVYGTDI